MRKLLKDFSTQIRSLYDHYRSKKAPPQVRYYEKIFEIKLSAEATNDL